MHDFCVVSCENSLNFDRGSFDIQLFDIIL